MANHFAAIGFAVWDEASLEEACVRAADAGVPVRTPAGEYRRWAPGAGAEIWAQMAGRRVVGLTPHFTGEASLAVAVTARVSRPDDTPLEGYVHAWANPRPGQPADSGDYPFVFAVPDVRALDGLALPARVRVQLAAFAHELEVFASADAYLASQADQEVRFSPESFIPAGMFTEPGETARPDAFINGTVLAAEQRTNPAGHAFWWMRVRTLGGELDLVAETELLAAAPAPGAVVSAECYLSGRVVSETPGEPAPRRSLWRRLRGG